MISKKGLLSLLFLLTLCCFLHAAEEKAVDGLLFRRVVPFELVYYETPASKLPALSELVVVGCRGEFEPGTLAIYSTDTYPEVSVEIDDLQSQEGNILPSAALDVRVVKVWDQQRSIQPLKEYSQKFSEEKIRQNLHRVPELLLTDDVMDPEEQWKEVTLPDGKKTYIYIPPEFPPFLRTELAKGKLKQFWVTVHIPPDQQAGAYRGALRILSRGRKIASLPLSVFVLPVRLAPAGVVTAIYFRSVLSSPYAEDWRLTSREDFLGQLEFLKDHGIESMLLPGDDENLEKALPLVKQAGLKGPVVTYSGNTEKRLALAKKYGYEIYFYGWDEVQEDHFDDHIRISERVRKAGGKVVTAIRKDKSDELDKQCPLDWANFSHVYIPATKVKARYDGKPEERELSKTTVTHEIETH